MAAIEIYKKDPNGPWLKKNLQVGERVYGILFKGRHRSLIIPGYVEITSDGALCVDEATDDNLSWTILPGQSVRIAPDERKIDIVSVHINALPHD